MPVPHPFEPGIVSRQPIARLAGTGGGLMLMTPVASVEALIAGVKVRCRVIVRDRHGRLVAKVFSPNGVDIAAGPYRPD